MHTRNYSVYSKRVSPFTVVSHLNASFSSSAQSGVDGERGKTLAHALSHLVTITITFVIPRIGHPPGWPSVRVISVLNFDRFVYISNRFRQGMFICCAVGWSKTSIRVCPIFRHSWKASMLFIRFVLPFAIFGVSAVWADFESVNRGACSETVYE